MLILRRVHISEDLNLRAKLCEILIRNKPLLQDS